MKWRNETDVLAMAPPTVHTFTRRTVGSTTQQPPTTAMATMAMLVHPEPNPFTITTATTYLAVNDSLGNVKLSDHAERDGTSARLGVVKLTLKEDGVNALLLGKDLGGAGTGRSSSDDGDLVLHGQSRRGIGGGLVGDRGSPDKGGGGEGRGGGQNTGDGSKGEVHCCCCCWEGKEGRLFERVERHLIQQTVSTSGKFFVLQTD